MKKKSLLLGLISAATIFALGASLTIYKNAKPTEVEAAQILENFDPYTYTGGYYSPALLSKTGGMNGELRTSLTAYIKPNGFYKYILGFFYS